MDLSLITQFYTPTGVVGLVVVAYMLAVAAGTGAGRWWGGLTGLVMVLALAFLPDIIAFFQPDMTGLGILASFTLPFAGALLTLMIILRIFRVIRHLLWASVTS